MQTISFNEWKEKYARARQISERIQAYILRRARIECKLAGLDPELLGIHPHNAMVSLHYGHPWPEVDYHHCRKSIWLADTKQWESSRIVDKLCDRLWKQVKFN